MDHDFASKIPPTKLAAMCANAAPKSSPSSWLINFSATSHITNDIFAFRSHVPYSSEDKAYIGDGQGMQIHRTGTLLFLLMRLYLD